ncbi:MAG: DUF2125 domain-containing protein [Beijerinckiaceae bacterium]
MLERNRSRLGLYGPFGLLILLAVGWSIYWYVGATLAERFIEKRIAAEQAKGRDWRCASRRIEGYPFHFTLRCDGLTLTVGQRFAMTLPAFRSVAMAYNPRQVIAELDGPVQIKTAGHNDVTANWQHFQVGIRHAATPDMAMSAFLTSPFAEEATTSGPQQIFSAEKFDLHGRPTPGTSGENASIDIALNGVKVLIPLVANLLNQKEPGAINLDATISKAAAFGPGAPIDNAERWRMAGGTASIARLYLAAGKIALDGKGELRIDDERRPAGTLSGRAIGLEQFLGGGGGLAGLLNFGKPKDDKPGEANAAARGVPFTLHLRDGRAQFGPIRFGNLPRLY